MLVSVFIPVYNGEKRLSRTLESVLSQTYSDLEVLCVDDSSTDGSFNLLKEFAARDNRVRVFQKPNGGSVPPSWEYVIPHIKGDFILYMSQDDLLEPDTIERLVKRQQETGADAVMPHEIHYHDGVPDEQLHHLKGINDDTSQVISGKEAFRLMVDYSISGRALWSTNIIRNIGMPADTYNADELAQRLWALECHKVAFSDAKFLYCQDNPEAITRGLSPRTYDDTLTNALLYEKAAEVFPTDKTWLQQLAGQFFHHLYLRMIQFYQNRTTYSKIESSQILRRFKSAYGILHRHVDTHKVKYIIASKTWTMMRCVVRYKYLQLRRQGIVIDQEFDCYSYQPL